MTLLAAAVPAAQAAGEPNCYNRFVNEWVCLEYLQDRRDQIVDATLEHIFITVVAVVLGLVLAFPLALVARRLPRLETTVLGVSTGIYTIPSLALLPLLVPFTGLSSTTVILGLGLYCLTILVRAMLDGLRAVPDDVRESATGLGYGPAKLLFRVELPLATPVVMAGLRVATVSTVALVPITALIGQGGFGQFINEGLQDLFRTPLVVGVACSIALAVLADLALVALERRTTPWARRS